VVDSTTRSSLISKDNKSSEIIKPLGVGDDIRKWRIESKNRWIIVTPIGINIKRYPAIFAHLQQWQEELENRTDQGKHWWELRPCDYYGAIDEPKIVFPDIAKEPRFTLDCDGVFVINSTYFIPTNDKFLLGVLNSSIVWSYAKERLTVLGDADKGGRLRFFRQFVQQIPIPNAPADERAAIAALAQKCLDAKGQGSQVKQWEAEIDERVARLYGLSAADLKAIKGE
jgi:hypothetical protein